MTMILAPKQVLIPERKLTTVPLSAPVADKMDPAADLAVCLDPVVMLQRLGIQADPWQASLLRSDDRNVLVNIHRQGGKSTTAAVVATHTALYEPDSLVLLLSPGLRQSQELFKKCLAAYHAMGSPVSAELENQLTLELANGSRIVSLPGNDSTIRGYSAVSLIVVDEASRVPDAIYFAVRPMLAVSGGRLVALSTPFGTRGWWYRAWQSEEAWERYEVKATDCPRISPEFLEQEQRAMGSYWFDQEYMCVFASGQTQAFRNEDIERAFAEEVETWQLT